MSLLPLLRHQVIKTLDEVRQWCAYRDNFIDHDGRRFNCRTSDTVILLGNGPSLKGFDFGRLKGFDVIGMNAAYRYWETINWYPRYYICLDTVVGLSHKDEIARLIRESDQNGIRYFILLQNLVDCLPSLKDHPRVLVFDKLKQCSSILLNRLITTGSHAALMCAVFGYTRIYLLGIDCNYVEFIPEARKVRGTVLEMVDMPKENPNYFFNDYQQKGDCYNIPNPDTVPNFHLNCWRAAGKKLAKAGVVVVNANRQSKVDAFPFCDFEDIEQGRGHS